MAQLLDLFGFLAVLLRGLTLSLAAIVIGGIFFSLVTLRPLAQALPNARMVGQRWILYAALALAALQAFWLATNSAVLMDTAQLSFSQVAGANFFLSGSAAFVAALLIAGASLLAANLPLWTILPAATILISEVFTSHAAARLDHRAILAALTLSHQGASAIWAGGLPFWLMSIRRTTDRAAMQRLSRRFSISAQWSVGILLAAGLGLSYFYIGSIDAVYGTNYGVMVVAKVLLFSMLVLFAAFNYFIVHGTGPQADAIVARLRRFGEAEIGIAFTVVLAAASLTSQPPAVDLTADRVNIPTIEQRMKPMWPRLSTPPLETLSPSSRELWKTEHRVRGQVESYIPGTKPYTPPTAGDIAWSEYNHHWAGIVVLLIGILAVLSRSGYAPWARHWPLAFVGLAVFLLLRADPENWPLGPNGFWESFSSADVMQHRLFVVLILAFAAFEWGVQTQRLKSSTAAIVFPLVCAVGGAVLLTHTHALSNIREELLAELSHIPLAILAVAAGWARWLELRLPPADRLIPSRVWPACFVLIGVVLVLYREA